jgi:O-antigen ligase
LLIFVGAAPLLYAAHSRGERHVVGGGAVLPEGNLLLELSAFVVLLLVSLSRAPIVDWRPMAVPWIAVISLVALALFQLIPFSDAVLAHLSPMSLAAYRDTATILRLFGRNPSLAPRISIVPSETVGVLLLIAAYTALFFSAASLTRTRLRRRVVGVTILGSVAVHILAAALRQPRGDRLRGAFGNPDHFAAYLEIALALALGAFWARVLTFQSKPSKPGRSRREERFVVIAGQGVLWSLIAIGIGLTRSRGGILSAFGATAILLAMAIANRSSRLQWKTAASGAAALLAAAVFAALLVGSGPFARFQQLDPRDLSTNDRVVIWKASLEAWRAFPIFGSGLGTFREAFRRFQPRDLSILTEHAHADSLQLLVTGGAIGGAIGVIVFGAWFVLLARAWIRQKHRVESTWVLAGFGALLSLTLHGLVDFNLSIPAISATLTCVLGVAWTAGQVR